MSYLLAFPIVPALLGAITLFFFFPESPTALIVCDNNAEADQCALQKLRNKENVREEIEAEEKESRRGDKLQLITMKELFTLRELRWPLITALALQMIQQLSINGINAVLFYSSIIFAGARISEQDIQYAILYMGVVNVIATIVCAMLIDKLGRKPLLVGSMAIMLTNFLFLTVFNSLQVGHMFFPSLFTQKHVFLSFFCH